MKVKEDSEKVGLKLNIQKTKIMASWSFHRGFPGGEVVKKSICHCKRYKRWEFYPWVGEYPGVGNGNPFNILACKILLSKKYGHNLKVELFYLVGMFRTLRRQQLSNSEKAAPRRQEEKGMTEDEIAGWHHWLDGHESEWTPEVGDGQGGLACCDSWGGKESDTTERLNWTDFS